MARPAPARFRPDPPAPLDPRVLPAAPVPWSVAPAVVEVAPRAATPPGATTFANLAYTGSGAAARRLDLAVPPGPAPAGGWPVIVAFPGAGWRAVDRRLLAPELAGFLREGYAVAVVDVTYAPDRGGPGVWPRNFEDARASVRWVRSHAGQFGVDPNRIIALGESSGANLALLLGSFPDGPAARDRPTLATATAAPDSVSARVQAVVDLYGPTDLARQFRQPKAKDKLMTFLGGTPATRAGRYAAASPLSYVSPRSAPTLIFQGTDDVTVPADQSIRLAGALDAAGVANRLVLLRGLGHGFQPERGGLDLIPAAVAFLDAVLAGRPAS